EDQSSGGQRTCRASDDALLRGSHVMQPVIQQAFGHPKRVEHEPPAHCEREVEGRKSLVLAFSCGLFGGRWWWCCSFRFSWWCCCSSSSSLLCCRHLCDVHIDDFEP
ncbi:unnamed protein product, partial [Ectocarpus sp. 13 AM-2016]